MLWKVAKTFISKAICLISSIPDDKKQIIGRYPKHKLHHYSSKRSETLATTSTRRQGHWWESCKQHRRTQPAQLTKIYRTFAVVTEPAQWNRSTAHTFSTSIKYFLTLSKSTLTHTQIFQSQSPHFLRRTPLQ